MRTCAGPIACLLLSAVFVFYTGGCAVPYKVAMNDTGAPQYQRVDISYRIPASHTALARGEEGVVGASGQIGVSRSNAALRIEYPHPQNKPEMVRATLRLSSKPPIAETQSFVGGLRSKISWLPGSQSATKVSESIDDEVWVLDFPRQQLDLMLVDLAHSGFFDDQNRHEGTAFLSIDIDRGSVSKVWSPEARLDDVVLRVQREGRRTFPAAFAKSPSPTATRTAILPE
jgi:hypothetical protein